MIKAWTDEAWEDFEYWLKQDKKIMKRILQLLKDIDRNGYEGIGKPEPLSGDLSSYWSRRIDDANRIVYCIDGNILKIVQCAKSGEGHPFRLLRQNFISGCWYLAENSFAGCYR